MLNNGLSLHQHLVSLLYLSMLDVYHAVLPRAMPNKTLHCPCFKYNFKGIIEYPISLVRSPSLIISFYAITAFLIVMDHD